MDVQVDLHVMASKIEAVLGPCEHGLIIVVDKELVFCIISEVKRVDTLFGV
jgi:hypothetical protein